MGMDQKMGKDESAIMETGEPLEGSGFEDEQEANAGDLEGDGMVAASDPA